MTWKRPEFICKSLSIGCEAQRDQFYLTNIIDSLIYLIMIQ
ncbi:hypothetical protein HMPREF1625_01892 [Staphylococcus aureus 880]|nr:hypothetical protein HMPREF1625_01892 [Staphylococcus aureus 880]